jgi:hypothetical protein
MEVSGQLHALVALAPKKSPVHILWETGCTPEPVWTLQSREKSAALVGNQVKTPRQSSS